MKCDSVPTRLPSSHAAVEFWIYKIATANMPEATRKPMMPVTLKTMKFFAILSLVCLCIT